MPVAGKRGRVLNWEQAKENIEETENKLEHTFAEIIRYTKALSSIEDLCDIELDIIFRRINGALQELKRARGYIARIEDEAREESIDKFLEQE